MSTIFSKIITREIAAQFVYEDEVCFAVMDKFPAINGQVLVIPRKEVDYAFDLEEETYLHIFKVAKQIAQALDKVFDTTRTCLVVEGFEVPHVHIKLYPMTKDDTNLASAIDNPKEATDQCLQTQADKIKEAL
jgi:histidine triad (HIT) family protein